MDETLQALKTENYNRNEPPIYHILRRVSVHGTRLALRTSVTPNTISVMSIVFALVATAIVVLWCDRWAPLAALALLVAYVLDCMDGEIARARKASSRYGIHLEHFGNWLIIGCLQIGATVGAYSATGRALYLVLGLFALFGWYGFYFFYIQVQGWLVGDDRFPALRAWSRLILVVMPADENLFILFAALRMIEVFVVVSAVAGLLLLLISFSLFMFPAYRLHRQGTY